MVLGYDELARPGDIERVFRKNASIDLNTRQEFVLRERERERERERGEILLRARHSPTQ